MVELNIPLVQERKTKNKVLYKTEDKEKPIDNIYISKEAFEGGEAPDNITVKIVY